MRRHLTLLTAALAAVIVLAGADGCSSDPDVEGAKLYVRQQDYAQAVTRLEAALARNPDNVDALVLKADVHRLQAEASRDAAERRPMIQQMIASLDRVRTLQPNHAEANRLRLAAWGHEINQGGQLLRTSAGNQTAIDNAVGAFENAVLLQPDSAAGHYNLGLAYLVAGNADRAIGPLEQAIERGIPDETAYVYLSRAYLTTGARGTDAVTLLEGARTRFPESQAIQAELLNAYAATGQSERALGAYDEAIRNDPENALLRYNYGATLLQAERYDEAITQLQHAIRLDPENANARYNLGAAFQNQAAAVSAQLRDTNDNAEANRLRTERDDLLRQALPHFTEARRLSQAANESPVEVCRAMMGIYTTLGMQNEAREAGECAGIDMN